MLAIQSFGKYPNRVGLIDAALGRKKYGPHKLYVVSPYRLLKI